MKGVLLSIHVLAAILTVGPVAIAASMFPPAARASMSSPGDPRRIAVVAILHRITRVYAVIGILVPVFGLATGAALGVLGNAWLVVSMLLTAAAAALLSVVILPSQRRIIAKLSTGDSLPPDRTTTVEDISRLSRRLAMSSGMFNLLWTTVTVLMVFRPGSTTGAGI